MKKRIQAKIKSLFSSIALVLLMVPTVFNFSLAVAYASVPEFNTDPVDLATLRYGNLTTNSGWTSPTSASAGDRILLDVYYHNCGTDTATNTIVAVDFPSIASTSIAVTGKVSADGVAAASLNGTINVTTPQMLQFDSTAKWYADQDGNNYTSIDIVNTGNSVQFNMGDITGGWPSQGHVYFYATLVNGSTNTNITSGIYTVGTNTVTNIPFGTAKAAFLSNLAKGESNQTWNSASINDPVVTGDTLVVTAQDSITTATYIVTTNVNPDIALVAADKDALTADSIRGLNSDLSNITVALTNPLPSLGANGSTITWSSDTPSIVSNDGQTINRPAFTAGDATVVMTATITKGVVSDTKTFTLNVIKLPTSTNTAITSTVYNIGASTITNIPFATIKATFLTNLTKGHVYQTWNDTTVADPVVTGDTLVVTAEDGITTETYTITTQPDLTAYNTALSAVVEATYTPASWTTYQIVVAANVMTIANTQAEVNTATNNIIAAQTNLITVIDANLTTAKANAAALNQTDYTPASWSTLTTALALSETNDAEKITKTNSINSAITALVFAGLADLNTAKANAAALNQADYTPNSWSVLTTTLALPETNNTEIVTKTNAINSAIAALVLRADKTALTTAINAEYSDGATRTTYVLTETNYTPNSWTTYTNAITSAITVEADLNATTVQVTEAINLINSTKTALILRADKTALTTAINAEYSDGATRTTYALVQADYTPVSWTTYTNAIASAITVEADLNATNLEVTNAINLIGTTKSALVFAGLSDLNTAKANAAALTETNYTPASWSTLTAALALPETNNTEIITKTNAINNAITALVFAGLADLNTAKANAAALTEANYTPASWSTLTTALALPETTNTEVVAKTTAINNAITNLVLRADKTALTAAINAEYSDGATRTTYVLTQIDYTPATWTTYVNSITAGITTENNLNATVLEVTNATNLIGTTKAALVFVGLADLNTAKANAAALVQADYTVASWSTLTTALAMPETTNTEVVTKTNSINSAITALVFAGLADLNTAKANAAALNQADYTPNSWAPLTTALALPETTNTEVVAKTTAINNAITNLVLRADKTALTAAINAEYSDGATRTTYVLIQIDYTPATWTTYVNSITAGITTENNLNATVLEVTNATNLIGTTKSALVFIGLADLNTAKANAAALTEADYTVASWSVLTTALAMPETTNTEVINKTNAINNAITALVFAGLADLNTAKANAAALVQTDYAVASWSTLTTALAMPETTNTEVVTKTNSINSAITALVFAGLADLNTAKANAAVLIEANYTPASWSTLTVALALPETTNTEVVTKTNSINSAITALVFAGLADLNTAKANAAALTETNYTPNSWTVLTTALALPETNNTEIVNKTNAINSAITALVLRADKTALTAAINAEYSDGAARTTYALVQADYTSASWTTYTNAIASAITVEADLNATVLEVTNATNLIGTTKSALVFAGLSDLNTAKANAAALTETDYTPNSWTVLTTALAMPETTNTEVVAKTNAINSAITALVLRADKTALTAAINAEYSDGAARTTYALVQIDYTPATWTTYINSITAGITTESDLNATVLEVTNATNLIGTTKSALVFIGLADLNTAKANAAALTQADYTVASWSTLTTALAMPETTNTEVVAKTTAINNAITNLVLRADKTALTAAINAEYSDGAARTTYALAQIDYTPATWTTYTNAIASAITVESDLNATVLQVTNATNLIGTTKATLVFAGLADLNTAKANAAALTEANYTPASWSTLTAALALPETTNTEVINKTNSINSAITALVFAGLADLNTAKANAAALTETNYTPNSWTVLTTALAMPETTNTEVVNKTTAINNAISGLVLRADKTALTTAINAEYSDGATRTTYVLTQADYTVASWTTYVNSIIAGITAESNLNATVLEVTDATDLIGTTRTGLISAIATVTSATYTVDANTIINVPSGTTKANFLSVLTKGDINQTWNDTAVADPVVTGNTLVSTAQDGTTIITYTITVNPAVPVITSVATDNRINNAEKAAIHVIGTAEANTLITVTLTNGANSIVKTQQLTLGATAYDVVLDATAALPAGLTDGTINVSVVAANSGGSSIIATTTATKDIVNPSVTKIGNDSSDVTIAALATATLTFGEPLSATAKTNVTNALTAGADKVITYAWNINDDTLVITGHATDLTTFVNDVMANVTDLAGNTALLLLIDSKLDANQTAPDGSGSVVINNTTPKAVITNPNQIINVTVSSGTTNPLIDLSSFINNGTGTLPGINILSQNASNITVAIPNPSIVTSDPATWDGIFLPPTPTTYTIPGMTTDIAVDIGWTGGKLSFDRAVRILFPNQADKRVGLVRSGTPFTEITTACTNDTQATNDLLAADGACKMNVGSDLVVWTKQLGTFVVYHVTPYSGGGGGGGGGSYTPAVVPKVTTTCTTVKKGDTDNDCTVGILDFNTMMINWGKTGTNIADLNGDKIVDILDFNILMVNWNK